MTGREVRKNTVGLIVALVVVVGLVVACSRTTPAELLQERCTVCHSLAPVDSAQKTREEWLRTVTRMVSKGAELDEDEQATLIEYLTETYEP